MSRRGFTLLETLIALAITALVLAALAGTVTASLRARDVAAARQGRVATAQAVLLHLERELAASAPDGFTLGPTLAFSTAGDAEERLAYARRGDALVRRAAPRFALADGAATPLVAGVTRFDARALVGGDWTTAWNHAEPPRAIAIELVVDGERLTTIAPIPTGRADATP
jgi:prepilin-type N-terminal cleavage/methylation domain-containing protein